MGDLQFITPAVLLARAKAGMAAVPNDVLFNHSVHNKLRESWCAALFGLGYERHVRACEVAVNESEARMDADFFFRTNATVYPFQLVETQEPGRARGAEYKAIAQGRIKGTPYNPGRGRSDGPAWIARSIAGKVKKHYAEVGNLNLLVYANFQAYQLQHDSVRTAALPHVQTFASVWVVASTFCGSIHTANDLGRTDGWGEIFTLAEYDEDRAG